MSNKYLYSSLKVLGFSESVINKIVRFLMSDCFDFFIYTQVRLNDVGCKLFTQESCRVTNGY